MPSTCQDNGARRGGGCSKETSNLKTMLFFCGLKKLPKLVPLSNEVEGKQPFSNFWQYPGPEKLSKFKIHS
jgi:hypothetical protein